MQKQNQDIQKGVYDKLDELSENPFNRNLDIKKLEGMTYRFRIGKIRAIYEINKKDQTVIILRMDYRGDIYKQLRNLFTLLF